MHRRSDSEPGAMLGAYAGSGWRILGHLGAMLAPSWLQLGYLGGLLGHLGSNLAVLARPRLSLWQPEAPFGLPKSTKAEGK